MAKKTQAPKEKYVRPGLAVRSLGAYTESVLSLITTVDLALKHNLVDPAIRKSMEDAYNEVNKFYED